MLQLTNPDGSQIFNVLSAPIRNPEKQVIGVVQFVNKLQGKQFTSGDVALLEVRAPSDLPSELRGQEVVSALAKQNGCARNANQFVLSSRAANLDLTRLHVIFEARTQQYLS